MWWCFFGLLLCIHGVVGADLKGGRGNPRKEEIISVFFLFVIQLKFE